MDYLPDYVLEIIFDYLDDFSQLYLSHSSGHFLQFAIRHEEGREMKDRQARLVVMETLGIVTHPIISFRMLLHRLIAWKENEPFEKGTRTTGTPFELIRTGVPLSELSICKRYEVMREMLDSRVGHHPLAPRDNGGRREIANHVLPIEEVACDVVGAIGNGNMFLAILSLRYFYRILRVSLKHDGPVEPLYLYIIDEILRAVTYVESCDSCRMDMRTCMTFIVSLGDIFSLLGYLSRLKYLPKESEAVTASLMHSTPSEVTASSMRSAPSEVTTPVAHPSPSEETDWPSVTPISVEKVDLPKATPTVDRQVDGPSQAFTHGLINVQNRCRQMLLAMGKRS